MQNSQIWHLPHRGMPLFLLPLFPILQYCVVYVVEWQVACGIPVAFLKPYAQGCMAWCHLVAYFRHQSLFSVNVCYVHQWEKVLVCQEMVLQSKYVVGEQPVAIVFAEAVCVAQPVFPAFEYGGTGN